MKKVLWICNIMLPAIGQELNLPYSNREGWLSGIFERVQKRETPFELGICFPLGGAEFDSVKGTLLLGAKRFVTRNVICYAFAEDLNRPENYDAQMEGDFKQIIEDFEPDLIHIFGTEFPHTLAVVRAFNRPDKVLIGIQGLCSEIAKVYMAGLPEQVQKDITFRDFIRRDSMRRQQEKFIHRGENEIQALRGCKNITGRTRFDREGTAQINPHARYYPMNETMRAEFYTGKWIMEDCRQHSIFLGQGDYPLKGMHFALEALALLSPKYSDIKLYVAGSNILKHDTLKDKLKLPAYGKYLLSLIKKHHLKDKVILLGKLDAREMKQQFLNSSVFICPSVLENSPNTVAEAQLLGVPVVASMAGGIPDMITDGKDGLLFPIGDVPQMAKQIEALWERTKDETGLCLAERISKCARTRAHIAHDGEANYQRLLEIYNTIE